MKAKMAKSKPKPKTARPKAKSSPAASKPTSAPDSAATGEPPEKNYRNVSTKRIERALRATGGRIYRAARQLKCSAPTIYTRIKDVPRLAELIEEERGLFLDDTEDRLKEAIDDGAAWAITLALKTLGRERGYTEKTEHEITGGLGVQIVERIVPKRDDSALPGSGGVPGQSSDV